MLRLAASTVGLHDVHAEQSPADKVRAVQAERERASTVMIGDGVNELADAAGWLAADQTEDLLASLYGLYAILRLHFLQEEENYFTLSADRARTSAQSASGGTRRMP